MGNVCVCLKDDSSSEVQVIYKKESSVPPPPPRLEGLQMSLIRTAGNGYVTHETSKTEAGFFQALQAPKRFTQGKNDSRERPGMDQESNGSIPDEMVASQQNATLQNMLGAPAKSETTEDTQPPPDASYFETDDDSQLNQEILEMMKDIAAISEATIEPKELPREPCVIHPTSAEKDSSFQESFMPPNMEIDEQSKRESQTDLEKQMRDMIDGLGMDRELNHRHQVEQSFTC